MKLLRIALIGFGAWGRRISAVLTDMPQVIVCSVCRSAGDWRATMKGGRARRPDAVVIASPAALHAEMTLGALDLNLPAFVEKPMALSQPDAQRVHEQALASKTPILIDHIQLWNPAFVELKRQAVGGRAPARISSVWCGQTTHPDCSSFFDYAPHPLSMVFDLVQSISHVELAMVTRGTATRVVFSCNGVGCEVTAGRSGERMRVFAVRLADGSTLTLSDMPPMPSLTVGFKSAPVQNPLPVADARPLTAALAPFLAACRGDRSDPRLGTLRGLQTVQMICATEEGLPESRR